MARSVMIYHLSCLLLETRRLYERLLPVVDKSTIVAANRPGKNDPRPTVDVSRVQGSRRTTTSNRLCRNDFYD